MKKIKVLQLCHGHAAPFADVAVFYSRLFDPQKYELTTIFLKDEPSTVLEQRLLPGKTVFYNLPSAKLKGLKLGIIKILRKNIESNGYQMIVAHRNKSIYLTCKASKDRPDILLVGIIHAYGVFDTWTRRLLLKANRDRLHLLGVSEAIRDDIANQAQKVGFSQVYAQPNCLSVNDQQEAHYSRDEARDLLGLPQDRLIIGTAGRLHWEKDQKTLIQAMPFIISKIPDVHLVIMGQGKLAKELQDLCVELQITGQVTFSGMVPEGSRYFKALDLFVLPSEVEPFGLVLIEAMVAGVAVLSSRTGGGEEILGRDEFLFPIGDVETCQQRIVSLLSRSARQKEEDVQWGWQRVQDKFSEEAFQRRFWQQPFLQRYN